MARKGELIIKAAFPPEDTMGASEWTGARWAFSHREPAGLKTTTLPSAHFAFRPLITPRGVVGVIGLRPGPAGLSAEDERVVEALLDQTTVAIERTLLVGDAARAEAAAESERLRSALLSSISHDLRTTLAAILGAVTRLRSFGDKMSGETRGDLLKGIEEETRRMSRFVTNLLDMRRIEGPNLDIGRDWVDLGDIIRAATDRARAVWPEREIELTRFLDDGRIEIDSNVVERSIRPIALNRKNALFAGSDGGAEHWAAIASLIETCKLNNVEPLGYLANVLTKIVNGHPNSQIDEFLPWVYIRAPEFRAVA